MVEVYFDGVLVDNPVEWEELSVSITFDHVNQVTLIEYDTSLTFYGSGNDYLYSRKDDSCQMIPVVIKKICNGTSDNIINGNILITDCVFDELECSTTVTIQDDGYSSRIQNNKSTSVSMSVTETKNGLALTPAQERLVTMFTPSTGGYSGKVRGYTVFEVFRVLVAWMSDNTVDFTSDYFETGDGANDWMCSGVDLRNLSDSNDIQRINPVSTSFEDLYSTHRKIQNLALGFQRVNNRPVLRIEPLSYFRDNTVILNLANVNKTELSYVQEVLYASIKIGSDILIPSECNKGTGFCVAENFISYYGFDKEEYAISGECSKGITLDLSIEGDFVIDTNIIEDVIIFGNESYDDSVFIINIFENTPSAWRAVQTDVFGFGALWYNQRYTNKEILNRYIDYLTGELLLFALYNGLNQFRAEGGTVSPILLPQQTPVYQAEPVVINAVDYDSFNTFDASNGSFNPPNEGFYSFCVGVLVDDWPTSPSAITIFIKLVIEKYDQFGAFLSRYESDAREFITPLASPNFEEWVSPYIPMNTGDYCIFVVDYAQGNNPGVSPGQGQIIIGGNTPERQYFSCCASSVAIQDIQANTGEKRRLSKTTFDYPIAFDDFKQYLNDTTKLIGVSNQRINRVGWNNEIKYNFNTGDANVSILSNDA